MMRLNNKNALVTAAANGIGRATAERFVAEGARVFAVDIDIATLEGVEGVDAYCLAHCLIWTYSSTVRAWWPVAPYSSVMRLPGSARWI